MGGPQSRARGPLSQTGRQLLHVGAPLLLICALAWPMLFTSAAFNGDWLNHLWFMWHQSLAIRDNHLPSLFLNYSHGVLYPQYAFYGGTIYALAGTLSLLLGDAPLQAYILTYLIGFAAAYGGWYWLARRAGLGRWQAHAPGLVFVTSAYYLTLIYARGDWPEFLAVSTIPLLIASGLSVLRADRLRVWPAIALAASTIVFFGSHNITMLWGSTILILTGLAIVACVPRARREMTTRHAIRTVAIVVPAALVNAWFLLPAVAYGSHTVIGSDYHEASKLLRGTASLVSASHLFTLSRASVSPLDADFAISLPVLAIAWVLVSTAILLLTRRRGVWMRMLAIVSAVTVAICVAMAHVGFLLALPSLYTQLEFGYRLESYILLGVSGAVLIALVLTQSATPRVRLWAWTLIPVLIVSAIGAIQQVDAHPRVANRAMALRSYRETALPGETLVNYIDIDPPPVASGELPKVTFSPASVHDDRISATVHLAPGQLVDTNLQGGPNLVHVTGATIVGLDPEGYSVLEVAARGASTAGAAHRGGATAAEATISLSPADSPPVVAGRLLSLAAAIVLGAGLIALTIRGRRAA
jgi:hypothetical protein